MIFRTRTRANIIIIIIIIRWGSEFSVIYIYIYMFITQTYIRCLGFDLGKSRLKKWLGRRITWHDNLLVLHCRRNVYAIWAILLVGNSVWFAVYIDIWGWLYRCSFIWTKERKVDCYVWLWFCHVKCSIWSKFEVAIYYELMRSWYRCD